MLQHLNATQTKPKRVVIIGASGFVGQSIQERLQASDVEVLPVSSSDINLLEPNSDKQLSKLLQQKDSIVTASAIAPCKDLSMLKDNIILMENLFSAVQLANVSHILNISSDAIYTDSTEPLTEDSATSPNSIHGIMHLTRERVLQDMFTDIPCATIRPTLIYGVKDPHNGYGPNQFRRLAASKKPIILFGKGEERRDHVLIDDVAELAYRILMYKSIGSLNAATGKVVSFYDVAELVTGCFDYSVAIQTSPRNGPMPHNCYRPYSAEQTQHAFSDFTYTHIEDGIKKVHTEMMENIDG